MTMKLNGSIFALVLVALVAGAAAAVATSLVIEPGSGAAPVERAAAPGQAHDGSDASALAASIESLRTENAMLLQRLGELDERITLGLSAREAVAQSEPLRAESALDSREMAESVAAMLEGLDGGSEPLPPAFVASVSQALGEIRAEEERQREIERKERQAERLEERLGKLQGELGLSSFQLSEMRGVLVLQDDKRDLLRTAARDGADRQATFEGYRTIQQETYTSLGAILSPEQLEGYKTSEESEFGFARGRRQGEGREGPLPPQAGSGGDR
jgi:hypothetical protein